MNKLFLLLLLISSTLFYSCGSQGPFAQVTFHTQTPLGESDNTIFPYRFKNGKVIHMRRVPDYVLSNVVSYQPFLSEKKTSYGGIFNLNDVGKKRLLHFSTQNQGLYMISIINGKVGEPVVIDRPISDGQLVVWDGLTQQDLQRLDTEIPRTDDEPGEWEERAKEAKKVVKEIDKERKKTEKALEKAKKKNS